LRFLRHVWRDVASLRCVIRDRGIDVVEVNGLVNIQGAIAARREGVALIWQILDTRPPEVVRRALRPLVRGMADVVMSTGFRVAAVHGFGDLGDRLIPFVPPVDIERFRADSEARRSARRTLGFSPNHVVVGTLANLTPQKGLHAFLDLVEVLRRRYPEARYVIFGRPMETHRKYARQVHERAAPLGVRVLDAGDSARALNALDIFVLTSERRSEGIPTTVLEAMATGLPVVATDVGAVREVVDETSGIVVPPADSVALVEGVERLVENEDLRRRLGARARAVLESQEPLRACADRHEYAIRAAMRFAMDRSPAKRAEA
jgi:glycosyltransferase involved in cell wall biosynthesis